MIKAFFTALLIFIVCGLENIGHYFGFCTHGMLASVLGVISSTAMGIAIYSKDINIYLRYRKYGNKKPHNCKNHHNTIGGY